MSTLSFRCAERKDVPLILGFIRELAEYEHLADEITADEKTLDDWLFNKKAAEVLFLLENGKEIGYALYFHNFSTFVGRSGMYLEDIYVKPEYRGRGYGHAVLKKLASIAHERGYGRMEWSCLDWNEPSKKFYRSLGAVPMSDWTVYRLTEEDIARLAESGSADSGEDGRTEKKTC